jgi:histidinol dehydrogenase
MQILDWRKLDAAARRAVLARPAAALGAEVLEQARGIIATVRRDGDAALLRYAREFDGTTIAALRVSAAEFAAAEASLGAAAIAALRTAIDNVSAFHAPQLPPPLSMETQPGVRCERLTRPIGAVGLYVPAGLAPLPSTVVMLAIPARLAGCPTRVLCTPPQRDGSASAAVLVAARLCGIDTVFKAGGDRRTRLRHCQHPQGRQDLRSWQCLGHGGQAAGGGGSRRGGAGPAGRTLRGAGDRR